MPHEPTKADEDRERSGRIVLDTHRVIRNGSLWTCMFCPASWPFPSPVPRDAGPCVARCWRDDLEPVRPERRRRLQACVDNWPAAETGMYHPRCCRWPKSCSATVYDPETTHESHLEPRA